MAYFVDNQALRPFFLIRYRMQMRRLILGLLCILCMACAKTRQHIPTPTIPPVPGGYSVGDLWVPDNYAWLEEESDQATQAIAAEIEYSTHFFKTEQAAIKNIAREIALARLPAQEFPLYNGACRYDFINRDGISLPIVTRRCDATGAKARFDLSDTTPLTSAQLLALRIAPDNKALLFMLRPMPSSTTVLYRYNWGSAHPQKIAEGVFDSVWGLHNEEIIYSTFDATLRPNKIFSVTNENSREIFNEPNPKRHLLIARDTSGETVITIDDAATQKFLIYRGARNPTISSITAPRATEITPVTIRNDRGEMRLALQKNGITREIPLPVLGPHEITILPPEMWLDNQPLIKIESFIMQPILYRLDRNAESLQLLSPQKSSPLSDCHSKTRMLKANDGNEVSLSLFHCGAKYSPHALLSVYGAYGTSFSLQYDPRLVPLLDSGVTISICHVRGGGEKGKSWHLAGVKAGKQQALEDLLLCRTALHSEVRENSHSNVQIALRARSAGAILAARALVTEPQSFSAVILEEPFLELLGSMRNDKKPLTAREQFEWGDPKVSSERATLLALDPYINIRPAIYPPVIVQVADHDPVVGYAQGLKFLAKLRANQLGSAPLLLQWIMNGDHSGARSISEQEKLAAQWLTVARAFRPAS
jgi:protease II